jgi:hypothetical protein
MRITVVCTDEQYAEIKKRAGIIPLSSWLKHVALAEAVAFEGKANVDRLEKESDGRSKDVARSAPRDKVHMQPRRRTGAVATPGPQVASGDSPAEGSDSTVVYAEHTAYSNRLTCLCRTCVQYRKNNDLPIGGLPKKEKR